MTALDLETALEGPLAVARLDGGRTRGLVDRVAAARGTGELAACLQQISQQLGFDYFSFVVCDPRQALAGEGGPLILSSYPDAWYQRYLERHYASIDAVVTEGRETLLPFFWGSATFLDRLRPQPRQLFLEARDFGIVSGFTVPVHGPRGDWGLLSLSLRGPMQALKERVTESYFLLQALAPHVHARALEHLGAGQSQPPLRLTDGERRCLDWTLRGKTAWEIAQIIGRSKPTVDYHIQKAIRKLDATNKHHAAFKAQQLGLI